MNDVQRFIRKINNGQTTEPEGQTPDQPLSAAVNSAADRSISRPPWELYLLTGAIIGQCALVLLGNWPPISAWLLLLLAISIGQALLLPPKISGLGGLLMVALWILFRQTTGLWIIAERAQNLFEIGGLTLNIVLAIRYRQLWDRQQQELQEWRALRELIYTGEVGSGLLPRSVADLRLLEEIERANTSRRPLGLLLVELAAVKPDGDADIRDSYRAVSRQLAGAALVHDVPFRVDANRLGLILLEREWEKLFLDTQTIIESLKNASRLDPEGHARPVMEDVALFFGLGTYSGNAEGEVDLLGAAEVSLEKGRKLAGRRHARIASYAVAAAPIVEARLVLWDGKK